MGYPYYVLWIGTRRGHRGAKRFTPSGPMFFVDGRRKPFMSHSNTWADEVACMPGCRVLAFDTGHWVMVAAPEAFNDAVVDWLAATDTVH
jgi:pimeloyl-ACP methyl ester carboxylesterase